VLFSLLSVAAQPSHASVATTPVNIGVLAHRGHEKAIRDWTPTAEWLTSLLPEYTFHIIPLTNDDIARYVESRKINFLLTNPASYALLEAKYGIARIATKRNLRQGNPYTMFGAIIFTRADRDDIRTPADLKGKSFMAVHKNAFGGWWMAKRELKDMGIEESDLGRIEYSGFPQGKIVFAVRDGKVDAGTVRTDLLERLAARGKINLEDFRILNPIKNAEFPFAHSTRLYPEWPFATLKHTPQELAQNVAIALFTISSNNRAAQAARIAGWTVPLDYNDVHALMKELKVGPYKDIGKVSMADILQLYWHWIAISIVAFLVMTTITMYVTHLNRQLSQSKTSLENEIVERRMAEEALRKARREAEAANQSKSSFLANMSHELRTPLNAIIGFSDVLGERMFGELNDKQAEYITDIKVSGHHLLSLINDILDLSKVEAGRMELELTRFDLPAAIHNAITLVKEKAARHGIDLVIVIDEQLGEFFADERKFKQILLNLLSNAVKFTPDGGRIAVKAVGAGNGVEITVSDSGPGIPEEDQQSIFEDFYQVRTISGEKEGTGLGLSLSKKFTELHGGTMRVASKPGKGADFIFVLPGGVI